MRIETRAEIRNWLNPESHVGRLAGDITSSWALAPRGRRLDWPEATARYSRPSAGFDAVCGSLQAAVGAFWRS